MSRYELLDHTADLAVRLRGPSLAAISADLAWAICDQLADADAVRAVDVLPVALDAPDREALLVELANELIYRREADGLLLPVLEVERADGGVLRGVLRGEAADAARHALKAGLKAATWHGLEVRDLPDGTLQALLVFDV